MNDNFDNQIYNILTVNSTVNEIVEIIRKHIPNLKIEYVDSQIMNQLSYTVANSKFQVAGFRFKGSLVKGIADTIHLIKNIQTQ